MTGLLFALLLASAPADLYAQAEAAEEAGDLGRARDLYTAFVERYPADPLRPGALAALAWVEIDLGRYDSALAHLRLLEADPAAERMADMILFARAAARFGRRDLAAAEADLRALLDGHPASNLVPEAEHLLGRVLLARGRAEEAERRISRYLESDDHPPDPAGAEAARAVRAEALARMGRREEALAAWSEIDGETAAFQRAVLVREMGRPAEAFAAFEAYLDSWPRGAWSVRAHAEAAHLAARTGNDAAATFHYAAVLAAPAGRRSFWALEARLHLARTAPADAAEARWKEIVEEHPRTAEAEEALEALARIAVEEGRWAEAADRISTLAAAAPRAFAAGAWGFRLAEVYFRAGDERAGLSALRRWLEGDLAPADRFRGAFLLAAAGRPAEAEPHLLDVLRGDDSAAAAAALVVLVRNRLAAGDVEGARVARARLEAEHPGVAEAAGLPETPPPTAVVPREEPSPTGVPAAAAPLAWTARVHVEPAVYDGADGTGALLARAVDSLLRAHAPYARDVLLLPPGRVVRLDEVRLRGRTDLPPYAIGADVLATPALSPSAGGYVLEIDLLWLGRPAPARRVPLRFEIPAADLTGPWPRIAEALVEAVRIEGRL